MEHQDFLMTTLFPYINFIIFLIVLVYIAKKPITAMFSGRRSDFLKFSEQADQEKKRALLKKQELESTLKNLDLELNKIMAQAKENAELRSAEMINQAKALSSHIIAEGKRVADAEISEATKVLRAELASVLQNTVKEKISTDLKETQQAEILKSRIDMIH